ncbi:beta-N-acetylhexosaminidase [Paenibacillus woosongensis]|uniref:Beta-N-acetylhexosaminidase n=1 Tax=Paenibacillus woosongensis TaxID=307580 RepID=A0AA95I438_9BACL|nr:beta-N-acetylhexosaminidase [Paenibacillus woosongensis]WHX47494.1 beta-N-acetylhexosaminidase [Paenibacillus woosongensis]
MVLFNSRLYESRCRRLELSNLTLEQKIGQMFICGFPGTAADEGIKGLIAEHHLGGIIYFRRNIESVEQLSRLSRELQQLPRSTPEIPLFISMDQEGGMVARLDHDGVSRIQGSMALGAANDPALTEKAATLAAKELTALGINLNFAPCVDVNNNPANPVIGVRSFGEDPLQVAEHGAAAIRGYQNQGVSATAKHFPGHGDTAVDSHHGLASVPHSKERLYRVELPPFRKAIESGVDMIMTAHVIFPAFEPDGIPATLSRRVLTGLLRTELGFEGVIITDCLEMHAISKSCGIAEGAVRAIEAGADIVLVSHTLEEQVRAIQTVLAAVQSGRLSEEQIDESVRRILSLKQKRIGVVQESSPPEPCSRPLTPKEESEPLLRQIAERSVTLVSDASRNLPLDGAEPVLVIWPELRRRTEVDEPAVHRYTLADAIAPYAEQVTLVTVGTFPDSGEIRGAIEQSRNFRQIIVLTYTAEGEVSEGQISLIQGLNEIHGSSIIVVSTRNPYDINFFPEIGTYLCLYENRQYALDALAKVLFGQLRPQGKLPVGLNPQFPIGHGL